MLLLQSLLYVYNSSCMHRLVLLHKHLVPTAGSDGIREEVDLCSALFLHKVYKGLWFSVHCAVLLTTHYCIIKQFSD